MAKKERWITVNGNHILIKDGQSVNEAVQEHFGGKKPKKHIKNGRYEYSKDGTDWEDLDEDSYNELDAEEEEFDANEEDDFGFDDEEEQQRYREAEHAMNGEDEGTPASNKVKIGSKEMTADEWKNWYLNLDDNNREFGRDFLLNHASDFYMSENDMEKFLGDNSLDVFNKFYDSIDLASEDAIENDLQYQIQDAYEKGKISDEQYNQLFDKIDKKLGVEGTGVNNGEKEPSNYEELVEAIQSKRKNGSLSPEDSEKLTQSLFKLNNAGILTNEQYEETADWLDRLQGEVSDAKMEQIRNNQKPDATKYEGAEVIGGDNDNEGMLKNKTPLSEEESKKIGQPHSTRDAFYKQAIKDPNEKDDKKHNTTPNQSAQPEIARKTKSPYWKDYMTEDRMKELRDYEYYSSIKDNDFEDRINKTKEYMERNKGKPWMEDSNAKYQKEIDLLSDPSVRAYVMARNEYDNQLNKDFEEYTPIARQRILEKLLGDDDFYETRYYGKDDYSDKDDLYDEIADDFQKKYGYETRYHGSYFSPLRTHFGDPKEDEERAEDGGYRRKYDKNKFIGEMLRNGDITFEELKKLLKGK